MYFVVVIIVAFAILLSDGLPPPEWDLLTRLAGWAGAGPWAWLITLVTGLAPIPLMGALGHIMSRRALRCQDGTIEGDAELEDTYAFAGFLIPLVQAVLTLCTFLLTGWLDLVRADLFGGGWPLAADLVGLSPLLISIVTAWVFLYPADRAVRQLVLAQQTSGAAEPAKPWGLAGFLTYRIRHQILTVFVPMLIVLAAKHQIDVFRGDIRRTLPRVPWAADALLGVAAGIVLILTPLLLRYVWATRPLPAGALRNRLEQLGCRIGMRYRDILVWESHGLTVNAAVMGIFAPVRYILLTDGLLASMDERQIEAVFGHEAGHVRRHHLLFFGVFSILSVLLVGGVLEIVVRVVRLPLPNDVLQLIALCGMLVVWGPLFIYISQKFERQADLYGTRCVTDAQAPCEAGCRVHDGVAAAGSGDAAICASAARLFGRTLIDVAKFNGIPAETRSWRHGSIQSRCNALVRFAAEPRAVVRFERRVAALQAALVIATLIGCAIAAWLYWPF